MLFHSVGATTIETPLTHLHIDDDLRPELMQTGAFSLLDRNTDEREHSGEMQYPFIAKVMLDALKITESNCIKCNEPNTFRKHLRVLPIVSLLCLYGIISHSCFLKTLLDRYHDVF